MLKMVQVGSSHSGLTEWLLQRVSALYLAAYLGYVTVFFDTAVLENYIAWTQWISNGYVRTTLGLFFLSTLAHAWIGMRSVFMDYLHPFWLRFLATSIVAIATIVLLFWVTQILLQVKAT